MNIGINCFNVDPRYSGGLNTYTMGLLDGFANEGAAHKFQIYANTNNRHLFEECAGKNNFELVTLRNTSLKKAVKRLALYSKTPAIYEKTCNLAYGRIAKLMDGKSDVIYTPTTTLFPYNNRKKTVISMHDIQQFHFPEFFTRHELLVRQITFQLSVDHVDYLQASSQFIKDDLMKHFNNLREEQIVVIPEGVDLNAFSPAKASDSAISKYGIPEEFIFFPAQLWPHKNHITVLKALRRIKQEEGREIPLVLTGAKFAAAQQVFEFIDEFDMRNVYYLGVVPFEDLKVLYRQARFMITAVLYESSSLPILEAAASGTPVIASKTPPNEEAGRILKLNLFEPQDYKGLADLICDLWDDDELIKEQVAHNLENIQYYSWNNAAKRYLEFFSKVVEA